jgi:hypothetical protein
VLRRALVQRDLEIASLREVEHPGG